MPVDFATRKRAYEKGKKMVSKAVAAKEEVVVWLLEDWKSCWRPLSKHATFTVDMGTTTLRFSLSDPDPIPYGSEGRFWLSLLVQPEYTSDSNEETEKTFKFQVDRLKENLDLDSEVVPETCITLDRSGKVTLAKMFIQIYDPLPENLRFGLIITAINFQSAVVDLELQPDVVVTESSRSSRPEKPEAIVKLTWNGNETGTDIKRSAFERSPFLRRQVEIAEPASGAARFHICIYLDAKVMAFIFKWLSAGTFAPSPSDKDFEKPSMYEILTAAKALELTDMLQHIDQNITSFITKANKSDLLHDVKAFGLENAVTAIGKLTP